MTGAAIPLADRVDQVLPGVLEHLCELVRIPTVSSSTEAHADLERSAALISSMLSGAGLERADVVRADGGRPAVIAERRHREGAPTVLLYAHHDVQPAGDLRLWSSDPYTPTHRDGRLYGRGSADDKGGVAVHLAALLALGDALPVNVTVVVDGEEEIGSPTLPALLKEHAKELAPDVVIVPDSVNWSIDTPTLTVSLRGLVEAVVEVRTLRHELHSGLWGGFAPDALTTLLRLLATLHTEVGTVAVRGLRASIGSTVEVDENALREEAGILPGVPALGTGTVTDRLWNKPSLTVTGIDAPSVADAAARLMPSARAKLSLRLAPSDAPDLALAALREHLDRHAPPGAEVTVVATSMARPCTIDSSSTAHAKARAALSRAWDGAVPVEIGVGGTIPLLRHLQDSFPQAALVVTGVEDPESHVHGADESVHLGTLRRACLAEALLLSELADRRPLIATSGAHRT